MASWTTTYSGLLDLLGDFVEDTSTEFTSAVQGCVNRAEERIIRDLDLVLFNKSPSAVTSNGVSEINLGEIDSPIISVFFPDAGEFLVKRTLDFVRAHGGSGRPQYFHHCDDKLYLAPTPDDAYTYQLTRMTRPTPLSGSNSENWLTRNVADLLLYASLIECEAFLIAPERVQEFEAKYAQLLGPIRGFWRESAQQQYEPINPSPTPTMTR